MLADEDETAEQPLEIDRFARRKAPFHRDTAHDESGGEPQHRAGGEDKRWAQRNQQAAERRPGNDRDLRCRCRARNRPRQHARRHDVRQRRLQARLFEGTAGADAERHGKQEMRRQPAGRGRERQHRDGKRLEDLRHENNGTPDVTIRRVAGSEEQSNARDELNEPDHAELKWAARQLVHQPADRDGLDLQRDRCRDPHIEEADIGAVAQKIDALFACHCGR